MAFTTENTFTGDGSTTDFSFTFPYINESDVKVTITDANGDPQSNTDFTFANATTLSFDTAPTSGRTIRIFRDTNLDNAVVTFFAGSAIRAEDLNDNQNQVLFSAQEVENNAVLTTGSTITGDQVFTTGTVVFEGATDDDNETTLAVTDPTADRTITLPNADGHVALFTADPGSTTISATPAELNTLDGITASTAELNLMDGVTATTAELNLLDGVTSTTAELNILDGVTATAAELNIMDGVTATTAELNFVDGVTSNVQTQLDNKQPLDAELTELATMGSTTASALADLTQAEVQILDGATVSTAELNLLDGVTATTSELNHVDGVTSNVQTQLDNKQPLDAELTELATMASGTASALADLSQAEVQILDGATVSTAELNHVDGVTSNVQTQLDNKQPLDSELTELATMGSTTASALADLTQAEVQILDGATVTTAELNKLDGVTASTTELNTLDGITSTVTELNLLDGVTATTAELNILDGVTATAAELNQLDGNTLQSSSTTWTSNAQYPSAAQIDSRITARIDPIGGFEAIADEDSFPATAPPEGTVISIANAGGMVIGSSASTTDATRAGGSDTVTIQNIPSNMQDQTIQDGLGMLVIATSTAHTYDFHRVVATNADVTQLSSDIDDFKARYRVGSSNPTTSLDEGDLFYNTGSDKMLVYDGSAWTEVQSIGQYFIIPASELADFASGTASTEVISNAPANASQIILSINGVIQEPNSGTTAPTDGFALDGSTIRLAATPPASSEVWGVIIGSTVNIGTPSADTVGPTQLQDTAVTAGSYTLSSITVDAQGRITAASSGTAADPDIITEGNTSVEVVDTGSDGHITFDTEGNERMRIDSSGRLLVGTSSARSAGDVTAPLQVEGTDYLTSSLNLISNAGATAGNVSHISLGKSRGTSDGSVTAVANGDNLGTIQWCGADGTDLNSVAASIRGEVDGTPGTNDMPGRLVFSTTADGGSSPTERMRIDSSGNVGIGTTSPSTTFHVYKSGDGQTPVHFETSNTNSGDFKFYNDSVGWTLRSQGSLRLAANNTTACTIDTSGRVGIGRTPSSYKLELGDTNHWAFNPGNLTSTNSLYSLSGSGYGTARFEATDYHFFGGNSERMRIDSSGRLLVGTSSTRTVNFWDTPQVQIEGTNYQESSLSIYNNQDFTYGPVLALGKSRGTSIGSNTVVQDDDYLGTIAFYGSDGSNEIRGAEICAFSDGTPGSGDMPGRLVFSTTADGASSPTERMRITSDGTLSVGASGQTVPISTTTSIFDDKRAFVNGNTFTDQCAAVMAEGSASGSNNSGASTCFLARYATASATNPGSLFKGYQNTTIVFKVSHNGDVTNNNNSYGAISDAKLKENIVDAGSQWNDIKALQVRNYNFKKETGHPTHRQIGLVAQEVELISPGLVVDSPEANNEVTKSINYSVLYMKAVKALQEAMARIEILEAKVAALEAG